MVVCPSICHTFSLCSHHCIIMKFSGLFTNDSDVPAKGPRSLEVKTPLIYFCTKTPAVWIYIPWCSHHCIIMKFSGLFTNDSDVPAKGPRSLEVKTPLSCFCTKTPAVWIYIPWWNDTQTWCCLGEVPYCFSSLSFKFLGNTAKKIIDFDPKWKFLEVQFEFTDG